MGFTLIIILIFIAIYFLNFQNGDITKANDLIQLWELDWIDVHDENVCPTCRIIRRWKERGINEWAKVGLPGAGHTICKKRCRCMLLPHELAEMFPKLHGQGISLREDEKLRISKEVDYKKSFQVDELVREWEKLTDDWNLPLSYYDLFEFDERIEFLNKLIGHFKNNDWPADLLRSLEIQNPWAVNHNKSHA